MTKEEARKHLESIKLSHETIKALAIFGHNLTGEGNLFDALDYTRELSYQKGYNEGIREIKQSIIVFLDPCGEL